MKDRAGNLVRTYTNDDIKALARVFTGMQYAVGDGSTSVNLHDPMEIRNFNNHDFDEKVFPNLRLTLPARTPKRGECECGNQRSDRPHLQPSECRTLYRADPDSTIRQGEPIDDVTSATWQPSFNDNGQGARGDLLAVVKAILLHNEALRSQRISRIRGPGRSIVGLRVRTKGTEHSKLVEPMAPLHAIHQGLQWDTRRHGEGFSYPAPT